MPYETNLQLRTIFIIVVLVVIINNNNNNNNHDNVYGAVIMT